MLKAKSTYGPELQITALQAQRYLLKKGSWRGRGISNREIETRQEDLRPSHSSLMLALAVTMVMVHSFENALLFLTDKVIYMDFYSFALQVKLIIFVNIIY